MTVGESVAFSSREEVDAWLASHHATSGEIWVRIFRKQAGIASVRWNDCVITSIAWGWIDGQRRSLDDVSFLQRLTPRRHKSNWSIRNREHAERLIVEGCMHSAGLAQVESAQQDGRWERAYAGSAGMIMPADILAALEMNPEATACYANLTRAAKYNIYYRLHTAGSSESRNKRMTEILAQLRRGQRD